MLLTAVSSNIPETNTSLGGHMVCATEDREI